MRKFKLQGQTSIDGYMAGPNWIEVPFTEDVYAYMDALAESVRWSLSGGYPSDPKSVVTSTNANSG
jgi:hypothetical protein